MFMLNWLFIMDVTLWYFTIAIENTPWKSLIYTDLPLQHGDFP
jgi:hypothetical protein